MRRRYRVLNQIFSLEGRPVRRSLSLSLLAAISFSIVPLIQSACLADTPFSKVFMAAKNLRGGKSDEGTKSDTASKASDSAEADGPFPAGSEAAKLYAFGTRQMEAGEFKKARDTFRTLAYKRPEDPMPMLKVANASFKAGDVDDALEWAKKACVASPKSAEAHLLLAHLFEANQDWKASCLQYEVIYELEPNRQGKLNIEYPMLRSLIRAQEYEKAEQVSVEWTKEYKHSADAFFNRAWTLSQMPDQGHPDEVRQEVVRNYRTALKLDPKRHDARFNLALILAKGNENEAACTELEKFVQEAPTDPDADRARSMLSKLRKTKPAE